LVDPLCKNPKGPFALHSETNLAPWLRKYCARPKRASIFWLSIKRPSGLVREKLNHETEISYRNRGMYALCHSTNSARPDEDAIRSGKSANKNSRRTAWLPCGY